ncbi:AAA family ATPase [Streptomyces liangshanensis]|uniref:AAA family ATPase n=1 Tax=Streptomyces liangshanensis TaxID=2717324 RepID=UPI0036DC6F83
MSRQEEPPGRRLGDRLGTARRRGFVGRAEERALFRAALGGGPDGCAVLFLHGPGGIGKSALLRRLGDDAQAAGRPVVRVDGRTTGPSRDRFAGEARAALTTPGVVLLADSFERSEDIEEWLREEFLPRLPGDAVVVLAGRNPPGAAWRTELEWAETLRVVALRNLPPADAGALLAARGVPAGSRDALLAFAGGHPLALTMAAEVAAHDAGGTNDWTPDGNVVGTLLSRLVGAVPTAAHQHALEVCAHAFTTTEELLRAVLPGDAGPLFTWLRTLPYVEADAHGLFPHDVVRDALDADLRWRDPQGYEAMHRRIRGHLLDRARGSSGPDALHTMGALSFLHRHGGVLPDFFTWRGEREAREDTVRPADREAVVGMARTTEGEESARLAGFWFDRRPADFRIHRNPLTGEPLGFLAWLRLTTPDEGSADDPVVAAAWHHTRAAGPLRRGEEIALARFMVHPASYQRPSAVTDLIQMRILSEWLRADHLAWSYLVVADPAFWAPQMDYLDQHRVADPVTVGERTYTLFAHDWRAVPPVPWLDRHIEQELFGPRAATPAPAPQLAVLSRPEFDAAVVGALRAWHRPDTLRTNPLVRSRLTTGPDAADPVAALRALLAEAVERLASDPRTEHLRQVLALTYLRGVPTQEAAAERLGLPFSTYRRHLARGNGLVCDRLWGRELHGAD